MTETNKVCACNKVTVSMVNDYLKEENNSSKDLETQLKDLDIGTRCTQCLKEDCGKIDTHYSEILSK